MTGMLDPQPGDRVTMLDREAEFGRTWRGTVTTREGASITVKLDAGGTFRFPVEDVLSIWLD